MYRLDVQFWSTEERRGLEAQLGLGSTEMVTEVGDKARSPREWKWERAKGEPRPLGRGSLGRRGGVSVRQGDRRCQVWMQVKKAWPGRRVW